MRTRQGVANQQLGVAIRLAMAREIDPAAARFDTRAAQVRDDVLGDLRRFAEKAEDELLGSPDVAAGRSTCAAIVRRANERYANGALARRLDGLARRLERQACVSCDLTTARCDGSSQCGEGFGDLINAIDSEAVEIAKLFRPELVPPRRTFAIALLSRNDTAPPGIHQAAGVSASTESGEETGASRVTLMISPRNIGYGMLCRLPYILYHEMICHVLQDVEDPSGAVPETRVNAGNDCEWTEGWMDTCAFALAGEWLRKDARRRDSWLPRFLSRSDPFYGAYHDWRYGSAASDVYSRFFYAREAFFRLAALLGRPDAPIRADHPIVRFSVALNVQSRARTVRPRLVEELVAAMSDEEACHEAAEGCRAFLRHDDPERLCDELSLGLSRSPKPL